MNIPVLTIIIVSSNDLERLKRTLDSLCVGNLAQVEILVVVPKTEINDYEVTMQRYGSSFRLLAQDSRGIYAAMNLGIIESRGKYLLFWNSGEESVSPATLEKLLNSLGHGPSSLIVGYQNESGIFKSIQPQDLKRFLLFRPSGYIPHHCVIMKKVDVLNAGGYDLNLRVAADSKLTTQILKIAKPDYLEVPVVKILDGTYSAKYQRTARKEMFSLALRELTGIERSISILYLLAREIRFFRFKILRMIGR